MNLRCVGSFGADVSRHHSVGLTGFEPATPGPPDRCANQAAPQPAVDPRQTPVRRGDSRRPVAARPPGVPTRQKMRSASQMIS